MTERTEIKQLTNSTQAEKGVVHVSEGGTALGVGGVIHPPDDDSNPAPLEYIADASIFTMVRSIEWIKSRTRNIKTVFTRHKYRK